ARASGPAIDPAARKESLHGQTSSDNAPAGPPASDLCIFRKAWWYLAGQAGRRWIQAWGLNVDGPQRTLVYVPEPACRRLRGSRGDDRSRNHGRQARTRKWPRLSARL